MIGPVPETLVIAGHILIPLVFGLVPGMIPRRVPIAVRWALWLALLILSACYVFVIRDTSPPFPVLGLVAFWISSLLSLYVLVVETKRAAAGRRGSPKPGH